MSMYGGSPEKIARNKMMMQMYRKGKTLDAIGLEFNVSRQRVLKIVKRFDDYKPRR